MKHKTKHAETARRSYKRTNDILEDHGDWLLVDISTPKFPDATMATDKDVFEAHVGGRISALTPPSSGYIYANYRINRSSKLFHHSVMYQVEGFNIDHIIHGTLSYVDNRRSNLRYATRAENSMNCRVQNNSTTGITGVSWNKNAQKWEAHITVGCKKIYLGIFADTADAVEARKQAEREHFGEFAYGATEQSV